MYILNYVTERISIINVCEQGRDDFVIIGLQPPYNLTNFSPE